jgi:HAD superfamily hydrolase (TIGR01457 family)
MKKAYKGILVDLDGTVYRGRTLIPGVDTVYLELSRKGIRWVFLSNNATRLPPEIAKRLRELGLDASDDQVVNSASALLQTLSKSYPDSRVMVIGEPGLVQGIEQAGAGLAEDPFQTDLVVVALDTEFTYDKLKRAHIAIQHGALFWATNLDHTFPMENGFYPGAGSIVAAVATAAGRPPDHVFGKPSTDMAALALEVLNLPAKECLVVGDRMDTDILFARNAGIDSALVLTGATKAEDVANYSYSPDYTLQSAADVARLIE